MSEDEFMYLVYEIVHLRAKIEYYRAELRRLHNNGS